MISVRNLSPASWFGVAALLMWSTLAVLTRLSGNMPPFQLLACGMTLAALVGAACGALTDLALWRQSPAVWALGVGGIFLYHACYFFAFSMAPNGAGAVNLLNYLWPVLIVVFSGFLPGARLRPMMIGGALLGFLGAGVVVLGGGGGTAPVTALLLALACAVVWSGYSVLSRRHAAVPSRMVFLYCAVAALLAWGCHLAFETTAWPTQPTGWIVLAALGLLPLGLAFIAWDIGVKHGDLPLLGVIANATPILSTLWLVLVGAVEPGPALLLGTILVTAGTLIAGRRKPDHA